MSHFLEWSMPHRRTGIISRTLSPSSSIKWILPARIRSKSRNDVVFVGETCIQLREFLNNGQLADATGKLVLSTQILSAKIISAKLEAVPTLDAILNQDIEEEYYVIKGRPIEHSQPPEILVISTAANELLFFYARDLENGSVKFVSARRPLLGGLSIPEKYGRHMAVDPESRALAIAPSIGYCTIFILKPIDEIKSEIDSWRPNSEDSFAPILEQRYVQVDGSILRMDFLRSTENDPTKVILVLLVANQDGTHLLLYRWDSRFPLHQIRPLRCSGQHLPLEDSFPLMLIPSSRNTSFILVTETGLALYDHLTTAQAKRMGFSLPKENKSKSKNTIGQPLWVQWAKPRRHLRYRSLHDDIVLVREDGLLLTYLISDESPMKIKANFSPGTLGINVDTAFCMLAGPPHIGGDILIAGGDLTDGGVFHLKALNVPERTQTLANIAPVQDMIVVDDLNHLKQQSTNQNSSSDRIFTCCGKREGTGAVVEICHGFEAQMGWTMAHPDSGSIEQFWSLELRQQEKLLLLASHPLHTSLVVMDLRSQEMEFVDAGSGINLEFDVPTLTAGVIAEDIVVQITRKSINLLDFGAGGLSNSISHDGTECYCACIAEDVRLLAMAVKTGADIELRLAMVNSPVNGSSSLSYAPRTTLLVDEPISMCFSKLADAVVLLVGTENGILRGFYVRMDEGLHSIYEHQLSDWDSSIQNSAISSLCVLSFQSVSNALLLCGLRDGSLLCLKLYAKWMNGKLILKERFDARLSLGVTSVTLSLERNISKNDEPTAIAFCLSELQRIRLFRNSSDVDYDIHTLWITNRDNLSNKTPMVNAVHRVPTISSRHGGEISGLIICATADDVIFCSITSQTQSLLRRIPVSGHPKRLVYSRYLKKIVVAAEPISKPAKLSSDPHLTSEFGKRPTLQFIDLDNPVSNSKESQAALIDIGEDGERIRTLMNWAPTDGKSHYEMIVLALERNESGSSRRTGRVVCISAKTILKGKFMDAHPKVVGRYPGKQVSSVCAVGRSSIAVAVGSEIILYNLDVGTRRWCTLSKFTLPSPALSIANQGPLIFVATAYHSLLVLENRSNKLTFHESDIKARTTSNVLNFNETSTLVTAISDFGTNIMGFAENEIGTNIQQVFEANVPLILDRVREDNTQSYRKSGRHFFYGSTTDGTLFQFTTLEEKEWRLLYFLESLCGLDRKPSKANQVKAQEAYSKEMLLDKVKKPKPLEMHVQGDLLSEMIEPGPYNLRELLDGNTIKVEDEEMDVEPKQGQQDPISIFKSLADPVIGEVQDPIGAVIVWLRKRLSYPSTW